MEEGNRQRKFSRVVQKELSHILQFEISVPEQALVTISGVRSTKDLSLCRVYIMVLPAEKRSKIVEFLNLEMSKVRHHLAKKLRHQVKQVPTLEFFEDDTLDYAEKMNALFDKIHDEEDSKKQ